MITPIYSDTYEKNIPEAIKKHIIPLLQDETVQEFNNQITFIRHGIYIFPQYKAKRYIINGFQEEIFAKMVSRLYTLLHDSSGDILLLFLEIVVKDGMQMLKPFPITTEAEQEQFEKARKFVDSINILRQTEQHNMKPDSKNDCSTLRKQEKILKEISKNRMPETQEEWENCISWIRRNCDNLVVLLNERFFVERYYFCLRTYYKKNMFDILKEVSFRKHKKTNKMFIQANCEKYKEEIADKAIELLKRAKTPVDPYKAVLQIVQNYL